MPANHRLLAFNTREILNGNELLVKGCLETEGGVHLLTGYPGSPVAGFFDTLADLKDLLRDKGIRAYQANNEALAAAAINGSQMIACRAVACMKSVGVHVASDALALAALAGAHPQGGAVIFAGDDPWCDSTQVPADSRFIFQHLRMAVVEPGTLQELKDWINLSFKLSQAAGMYVGYIITTAQADGGGSVWCYPNQFPQLNTKQRIALETSQINLDRVLLPPRTWQHELQMPQWMEKTVQAARRLGINRIVSAAEIRASGGGRPENRNAEPAVRLGFIVTGMAGPYLDHVLADLGLTGAFPILQMGMSYPVDIDLVRKFSGLCANMIVVEERRGFLEMNIRDAIFTKLPQAEAAEISSRLFGKKFPGDGEGIPEARGLNYSVLAQRLVPLVKSLEKPGQHLANGQLDREIARLREASRPALKVLTDNVVPRTPTFCPGCPHRDSSAVMLEILQNFSDPDYMRRHHGRDPVQIVAHGDTGCYTMLMFPPTQQLMHNYSGMGLGAGTGSGIDPFITNKQIAFMGDSTFFHSGQIAITNAIKASQDITFILLENGTTAMTGHQDHAANAEDMFGNRHYRQDIESILRGIAAAAPIRILRMRPELRDDYKRTLEETILADGVKIIIADKECGITARRKELAEQRRIIKEKGYLPRKTHMNVTPEVCEGCMECTKQTTCPGLFFAETDYGPKIDTDLTWCVNDGACERVRVSNSAGTSVKPCPSFEEVTIVHRRRRRYLLPNMSLDKLPEPQTVVHPMLTPGDSWRCHMSGVGGMGIGVVSAILVRAGHKEGYRVIFQEKKGLAIRNGGVYAQVTFVRESDKATKRRSDEREEEGTEARRHDGTEENASALSTQHSAIPYSTTGSIPYGRADLLLGLDILESARAVDPRDQFRIASPQHTCAVLNLHKQPTVNTLLGTQDFDPDALREQITQRCRGEYVYVNDLSAICEQRLGSKLFSNILMLGVAYQLGLIPVSAHSIAWAIKDSIKREHRRNLKAFNIGRKLALEPRALPRKPQPQTWDQLLTNKSKILRKTRVFGRIWAVRYENLVNHAMLQMPDLPGQLQYDLTLRLYDILQYQDHRLARRYLERVIAMYQRDSAERRFAATAAVIWNLAKVMLIKDETYVAYLLTRYEKKQRDIAKYGIDPANGDRIVYKHHTNPELTLGPIRLRFKLTTRQWMLKIMKRMKWLRKLPGWHRRERAFRDWYISLLDRTSLDTAASYDQAVRVLTCPESVSGYREVRYPKMDSARAAAESDLSTPASPSSPQNTRAEVAVGS